MFPIDERLMIGLKVLERIWPNQAWAGKTIVGFSPVPGAANPAAFDTASIEFKRGKHAPSLEKLLEVTGPLPSYAVILGTCADGLPFLLDLANPAPGAILIAGDPGCGKRRLLKAILASAIHLNPSMNITFHLVSPTPEEFSILGQASNCQRIEAANPASICQLIHRLVTIAETQPVNAFQKPVTILALDDLFSCTHMLEDHVFATLHRLLTHGPRAQIWPIATLSSESVKEVDPRLLKAFRTRLLGHIADQETTRFISGEAGLRLHKLAIGKQFCIPYGGEWLRFWICAPRALEANPNKEAYNERRNALV